MADFERLLFPFLQKRSYVKLGWARDKQVRDTGPFLNGTYYGTHPAVRVFYSPEIMTWLKAGQTGTIPDGAMIVKEQYAPPAARHEGKSEEELRDSLESWTVMVKDAQGSHDGWFWSNPASDQEVVDNHADFSHPISGFGLYCVRCHASTRSPGADPDSPRNEFTFASLRNIAGFDGEPILFRVDDSWREQLQDGEGEPDAETDTASGSQEDGGHPDCSQSGGVSICTAPSNDQFISFYGSVEPTAREQVDVLPPMTHDWVPSRRDADQEFVTSNQCMSCHAGLLKPFGPTMFIPAGEDQEYGAAGWDISPFGEWRWTPMGLAGRDPIFLAQLESETAMLREEFGDNPVEARRLIGALEDTCLRCHGAMGRHQFRCDANDDDSRFSLELCDTVASKQEHIGRGLAQYGALAREGISCMVCHRMQPRPQPPGDTRHYLEFFLETSVTGNLHFGPPNEVYGPFKDKEITPYPMQHALGLTPRHSDFIKSSQLCGSCHTVSLPAVDRPLPPSGFDELNEAQVVDEFVHFHHHIEQATYLEWLNSEFENEFDADNPQARSCQDCHMERTLVDSEQRLELKTLPTRMAIIQDTTYPDAENLASHELLNVRVREKGFARHNFSGLNLFLLELFDQFPDVLGVRKQDFMTGSDQGLEQSRKNFLRTAQTRTADLNLVTERTSPSQLTAEVTITNKTGHRFPTGVGFRRAFVELMVVRLPNRADDEEAILWASGRTDELGVLIDKTGQPLSTEFFDETDRGIQRYQPHHEEITSEDQVQIYESLLCNAQDRFTTSFLHACTTRKDNRLLPRGWTKNGPDRALSGRYLEATHPSGAAAEDPRYGDGSGTDTVRYRIDLPPNVDSQRLEVRAALYYQAIPPYFLSNLFQTSPTGKSTRRLYFLLSHLDLTGTALENWKLEIARVTKTVASSIPK